jgi:adenylate cyclase
MTARRSIWTVGLVVWALAASAALGARELGLWHRADLAVFDRLVRWRESPDPPMPVAVVRISEQDIDHFGYPLSDEVLAQAIERISEAGARTIAVDLFRPDPVPPGQARLRRAAVERRAVFIHKLVVDDQVQVRRPPFVPHEQMGFADIPVDVDGVARRTLLIAWDSQDQAQLSLALVAALDFLGQDGLGLGPDPDSPDQVRLGGNPLPPFVENFGGYVGEDDRGYQLSLDFIRKGEAWPFVSIRDVIEGTAPAELLRGRVVLIGTTASSVKDMFHIPLTSAGGLQTFGVDLHAHIVDQLIRTARGESVPLRSYHEGAESGLVVLFALIGTILGLAGRRTAIEIGGTLAAAGILVGLTMVAFQSGVWVPVVPSAAGLVFSGALGITVSSHRERAEKAEIRGLFSRYAPAGIVDILWSQRANLLDAGRPRPVELPATILMADIGGSTQTIHELSLGTAAEWIDRYLELMATAVSAEGGVVVDYAGDGLKADFGVPVPRTDPVEIAEDARRALRAALAIGRELETLNASMAEKGLPTARIRMGICSGTVAACSIGGSEALRYTTIGDAANLAAHLESTEKEAFRDEERSWRVLLSETTLALVGDAFEVHPFGTHSLKGVDMQVYRAFGSS